MKANINGTITSLKGGLAVVNGTVTALKKGMAVVNGVWTKIWEAIKGVTTQYKGNSSDGTINGLCHSRYYLTATNVAQKYVVFSDGVYNYSSTVASTSAVDAYNTSLTQTIISDGSSGAGYRSRGSASVGNYALFTGGYQTNSKTCASRTKSINTSLTYSNAGYITHAAESVCGGSIGNYAIFLGGKDESGAYVENGDVYNSSLTQSTTLSWCHRSMASANVGNYVLFSGGYDSSGASAYVRPYDSSVTYQNLAYLGFYTYFHAGAETTNHAVFAGGGTSAGSAVANACAFNSSLTRTDLTPLADASHALAATSLDGIAIFAGGGSRMGGNGTSYATSYYYNDSLTQTLGEPLSQARDSLAAASVGKYAFFGGGTASGSNSNRVDVYTF